jgi:hypothetical protein
MQPSRPLLVADNAELERACDRARCRLCMATGGETIAETRRIVCKVCGQFIAAYDYTAPRPKRFVVTLEPCDPSRSYHALRRFLKDCWRICGLKCLDLGEEGGSNE